MVEHVAEEIKLFVEDVSKSAVEEVNPNKDEQERLLARRAELQAHFVAGIRRLSMATSSYDLAHNILGKDFVSPEDVVRSRNVSYSEEQLAIFRDTIPSQEVLEWCRDQDYVLVAGPNEPMSLLKIRDIHFGYFEFKHADWLYHDKKFASKDLVGTKWIILRKNPFPSSINLKMEKQDALLSDLEFVPNVAEVAWVVTTYKAVRDVYLLKNIFVRTSSIDSNGYVCLGGGGPIVVYWRDSEKHPDLGLAVARKQF